MPSDPNDPTPIPPIPPPGDFDALARMNAILSEMVGSTSILKNEQAAYSKLVEHVTDQYDELVALATGLDSSERAIGRQLLRKINDQKDLILAAEKYLNVQKGITKEQKDQEEILRGIRLAGEKMGLDPSKIREAERRAEDDFAKNLIDTRIMSWTAAATKIGQILNIDFQSQMVGAMGRGVTLARGANAGELSPEDVKSAANKMFGAMGSAMGPLERVEAFNKIMAESPKALGASADGMFELIGTMAAFGASTDQMISTLIKGARESGLTTADISRIYRSSNIIAKDLGLSTLETSEHLMEMTRVARQSGGSINAAQTVLSAFSKEVTGAGVALTGVEKLGLANKFVTGVFGMPVDKLLGLAMFTTGKPLQSIGPSDVGGDSALGVARNTWDKISRDVGGSYAEQLVATQKIAQLLGVNVSNLQEVEALQSILKNSSMDQAEAKKQLEIMSNPMKVTALGIADLKAAIPPLTSIDNTTKQILSHFTWTGTILQNLVTVMAGLRLAGVSGAGFTGMLGAGLAGGSINTLKTGLAASRIGRLGAGGAALLGGAAAAEVIGPALLIGGGLMAGEWAINKAMQAMGDRK